MNNPTTPPPIIFLLGPTGTGKSALALELAAHSTRPIEIVSADAVQVYQGLDIGSAKPGQETQQAIPHHLLDLVPPTQVYSAADYLHEALGVLQDIIARDHQPLVVGGTMFYVKTLLDGIGDLPASKPEVYADPTRLDATSGADLHRRLTELDPVAAQKIEPNNHQRVLRALELLETGGGKSLAEIYQDTPQHSGLRQLAEQNNWQLHCFALNYADRSQLRSKLAERFHEFMAQGLLAEVKQLRTQYPQLDLSSPALRAIGYRQLWEYLAQLNGTADDEAALAQAVELAIIATGQFAKRQLTWLRHWPELTWLDAEDPLPALAQQVKKISGLA